MAPVALLAKVTGSAWGLAIARLLTAAADTACVALLGLLVRHRGPVAAGIACGIYAVYPDALVAAHTLLLEPWLNLFCLVGALLVFDGDRLTDGRRLAWGGVAFGFAAAVKLWALVPLAVIGLLLLRRPRRLGLLAGGAVAGLGAPVLPFLALAPTGLTKDVVISQFVRANLAHPSPLPRLTNLAGLSLFPHLSSRLGVLLLLAVAAIVAIGYMAACRAGARLPTALDWYALIGLVAVTGMLLWSYGYWTHYGAVAGPFIALVLALPAGLLRPAEHRAQIVPLLAVCAVAVIVVAALGLRQFATETRLHTWTSVAVRADRLIPPGACVLTDDHVPDRQRRPVRLVRAGVPGHGGRLRDPAGHDRRAQDARLPARGALGHGAVERGVCPRAVRLARNRERGADPVDRVPVRLLHRPLPAARPGQRRPARTTSRWAVSTCGDRPGHVSGRV